MIIDDHPIILSGVKTFLSSDNRFEFIGEFTDTRTALNAPFNGTPDLIILDLAMPKIDGERSLAMLKRKFPNCKFLAFTQYENRAKTLKELGFDGYFVKTALDSLNDALLSILNGENYFKNPEKSSVGIQEESINTDDYTNFKKLTSREIEVANLMVQNFSNREIGNMMHISETTVETHRKHIKEKMQAKTKSELFAMLRNFGLGEAGENQQ